MPDKNTFCTIPWNEVHINADGTYHSCGAQTRPFLNSELSDVYNVFKMTIPEWVNSDYRKKARLDKLNGVVEPLCRMCYHEDAMGSSSKRVRENLKSKIDYKDFDQTYQLSPDLKYFQFSAENNGLCNFPKPNSYHISLGNECNLACRMCHPSLSSKLAVVEIKNGTYSGPARINWTTDNRAWNSVVDYICGTEDLKFVHLIGGEPLMNPRFEEMIDKLLAAGKTDIYLGFTTNGTMFSHSLMEKLNAFRHVDVGVSIECLGILNEHIRPGANTQTVLDNIDLYLKYKKESHVYVTVRPVPSALSVHLLDDLYRWCVDRQVDIMSNMLTWPTYQQIKHLPATIKQRLVKRYETWQHSDPLPGRSDPRDPNRFKEHIDSEILAVIKALNEPGDPLLTDQLYATLDSWGWLKNPELSKYFTI